MGDDAIRALRAALSEAEPEYDGEYFTFGGFVVEPAAVQAQVPIWVGGRTARSLRRAVELADGWAPFGLRTAELGAALARARDTEAWAARDTAARRHRAERPSARPARGARPGDRADRAATGPSAPPRSPPVSSTTPSTTTSSSSPPSPPSPLPLTRFGAPESGC